MAKEEGSKPETKSEFLRKLLRKNPNLTYKYMNRRWAATGHAGEISNALYYQIRAKLGIKTEWVWVKDPMPRAQSKSTPATGEVYQFKVTLMDATPPLWRRIQVSDCTLDKLHEHVQTAMGWTNSHMHHFRIDGRHYGDPMLLAENFAESNYADSTRTRLSDILPEGGQQVRFEYEYDFGDGWLHEIRFEGRVPAEPGKYYPLCSEGERACPPEDVGGVWGYMDFLKALADPKHEQHNDMRAWIGGKFDPGAFNPAKATKRMIRGLPDW